MEKLVVTCDFGRTEVFEGDHIEYYVNDEGRLEGEFKENHWLHYDWSNEDSVEEGDNENPSVG